jgi:hypothetical protein
MNREKWSMAVNEVANKRIPVTSGTWESLSKLKRPGQTYDSLLEEMIALKEEHDFLMHLEEIEKSGDFVSLAEAAYELKIKGADKNFGQ